MMQDSFWNLTIFNEYFFVDMIEITNKIDVKITSVWSYLFFRNTNIPFYAFLIRLEIAELAIASCS